MPTMYLRQTDPSGKVADVITAHSVWDADKFLAVQRAQYEGDKVKENDFRVVTLATEAEYRKHRNYKGY